MALLIVDLDKHIGNAETWRDTFADQLPDLEDGPAIRQSLNMAIDRFDSHWHDQNGYPSVYMKSQQPALPAH